MMYLVRRLSVGACASALVLTSLVGCVSQACPDGQKLTSGKCVSKSDAHDAGSPSSHQEDGGGNQDASAEMHRDPHVDAGEPGARMDAVDAGKSCGALASVMCWKDADADGFAAAASASMHTCGECPTGWTSIEPVNDEVDCKDSDAKLHPIRCWRDNDKDGYAAGADGMTRPCATKCAAGMTAAEPAGDAVDCDDKSADIHPNALEACNGEDDDCDRGTDEDADKTCDLANASGVCVHAACAVDKCKKGFDDCDHEDANGCEQALNLDGNCGACGVECSVLGSCNAEEKVGQCECQPPSFGDGLECRGPGPLNAGTLWTCAIASDKVLACWGQATSVLQAPATTKHYQQVATGAPQFAVGCGVTFTGAIECWSTQAITGPQAAGTTSKFVQVVVGEEFICGLTTESKAECWIVVAGITTHADLTQVPDAAFTQLAAGGYHVCGLHPDGTAECWGAGLPGANMECEANNHLDCGQSAPPSDKFVQLTAGLLHTCGLLENGDVKCWGLGTSSNPTLPDDLGQGRPPADIKMVWISAGARHTCGISADDGSALCWGAGDAEHTTGEFSKGQATPPAGHFLMLSAGWAHTCGLTLQEDVVCWGDNGRGQAPALTAGPFPLVPTPN